MTNSNITRLYYSILLLAILGLTSCAALAQNKTEQKREFCTNYNNDSWGNKRSYYELRESTVRPGGTLTVDGMTNGGIRVEGSNRSDILVRACIQTWDDSDNSAKESAKNIRIETSPTVRAAGLENERNMSVSYEILVPRSTNLKLTAHNGGIRIRGVDGSMDFTTTNGGVSLDEVAGDVRGRTSNGGVTVNLTGSRWNGRGLDVQTTNGGVRLTMPQNYAARLETGTVNGGFRSDLDLTVKLKDFNRRGMNISTDINGGGAPIRVITTNGGVSINASK